MNYKTTTLDNGIRIISESMPHTRTVSLGLWFCVGSRDEQADQAGLAHFMEHMMFKGTPTRSPLDISMQFDALGAEFNAFTSKEYTCYYARFVNDKIEQALEILSDMVINSTFDQEAIDTEREVVIEELVRSEDTPDDAVFELFTSSILKDEPLGKPILGTKERVGSYMHADCVRFHDEHYHTGNLIVACAGDMDHEQLIALVQRYFASMKTGLTTKRVLGKPTYQTGLVTKTQDIEQAHLVYGFPWYTQGDPRRFAGSVLTSLLGGSMSSRLFQEVREKRGLVYSIFATQSAYQGAGLWCVYAGTRLANVAEAKSLIEAELQRITEELVSKKELQRNIDLICGQLALGFETSAAHMNRLGKRAALGLPQDSLDELIEHYRLVDAHTIRDLAQTYLTKEPLLALVSPATEQEALQLL